MAPIALVGVAGLGVVGRLGESPVAPPVPSPAPLIALASPAASDGPAVSAAAAPTPSHRSDWPAAIGRALASAVPSAAAGSPAQLAREEGTDGLMGGRPFHIPGDTPYHRPELVNRFTIDDRVIVGWSSGPSAPTKVHRIGGLANFRVDPRER